MRNSSNFARLSGLLLIGLLLLLLSVQGVNVQAGVPAQATSAGAGAAGGTGAGGNMRFPACAPAVNAAGGGAAATAAATLSAGGTGTGTNTGANTTTNSAGAQATAAGTQAAGGTGGAATGIAYLGIQGGAVQNCGVEVLAVFNVFNNSPAAAAGLRANDVIVAVNGQALAALLTNMGLAGTGGTNTGGLAATQSAGAAATQAAGGAATGTGDTGAISAFNFVTGFFRYIAEQHKPGDVITLTIQRAGAEMDVQVTLGVRPPATPAAGGAATGGTSGTGGAAATATAVR